MVLTDRKNKSHNYSYTIQGIPLFLEYRLAIPVNLMTLFIGANPRFYPDLAAWLNPLTWITKDFPPTLVQVGDSDAVVPCTESEQLAAVIERRCGKERVRFEKYPGWNHCALNHIVTLDWFQTANQDRVFAFLDEVLK